MKEKAKTVDEQTAYLALAISCLDSNIDEVDKAFKVLEGKANFKLNADCIKLLKFFSVGDIRSMDKINLKIDRKDAETLYKFTSMLNPLFEMTLADRMGLSDDEIYAISDSLYNLNEKLRKVIG